jgi:ParB family chromosome partitioning protein
MSGKAYLDILGGSPRVQAVHNPTNAVRVEKVPVSMVDGDPEQPRRHFDEQELRELADSLREHGQLQPVRVRRVTATGRYVVVAGERRLRASKLAGLPTIDAIVLEERVSIDRVRIEQVVENLQRSQLSPLETAEAYRKLINLWGVSQAELARRLGVGTATVSRALSLLEAPEETRAKIAAGESVRQATSKPRQSRKRNTAAKPDKRRAIELELPSGFVRVKRGATLEQLVADLQAAIREQGPRAAEAA